MGSAGDAISVVDCSSLAGKELQVKPTARDRRTLEKPDHLTMRLFGPGMSLLHRAGLGGLACTLRAMEDLHRDGRLPKTKLPAPFKDGNPPWEIETQSVTLWFGKPENAEEYLKKLFAFAFAIGKDGLIRLPGQFDNEPSAAVLADMQAGLTLTFLQHGKVRQLEKDPTPANYDPEGDGVPGVVVQYRKCSGFKHQEGWKEFAEKDGTLTRKPIRVDGPISPGTVVRHVAFTGDTVAEDPPERMLPLYFALVGCLPLAVNRGVAALLVPEVDDLTEFVFDRRAISPTTAGECQIANAADAALQAQVRLRGKKLSRGTMIPSCYAMTFTPTAWASQQKSRVATVHVARVSPDDKMLDRFARALQHLPNRIVTQTIKESSGRGRYKTTIERQESFRSESVIRPLIAENLALGRPWYAGFTELMFKVNPATDKPYRNQLPFERKGLHAMIADSNMWNLEGEKLVVQAVHEAIRMRYGQIADENKTNPVAMRNRMESFRERLRLDLAGAKTEAHARFALMDLFSRGVTNSVLRAGWERVLPVIREDWQLARDLGLLALASYVGRGGPGDSNQPETTNQTEAD
jgi:CRISPR-associated protein Cas8a1/Csx13